MTTLVGGKEQPSQTSNRAYAARARVLEKRRYSSRCISSVGGAVASTPHRQGTGGTSPGLCHPCADGAAKVSLREKRERELAPSIHLPSPAPIDAPQLRRSAAEGRADLRYIPPRVERRVDHGAGAIVGAGASRPGEGGVVRNSLMTPIWPIITSRSGCFSSAFGAPRFFYLSLSH